MFNTPVLVTKLNLQMQNLFSITDETKMPGFNHSRMDRPNAHLVQFFTVNIEKRIVGYGLGLISTIKGVPYWFEPWMVFVFYTKVFMNFAFKFFKGKVL